MCGSGINSKSDKFYFLKLINVSLNFEQVLGVSVEELEYIHNTPGGKVFNFNHIHVINTLSVAIFIN